MRLAVRLDSGATVTVKAPRATLYREGVALQVEVLRREWPPHAITYRFVGYAESRSP